MKQNIKAIVTLFTVMLLMLGMSACASKKKEEAELFPAGSLQMPASPFYSGFTTYAEVLDPDLIEELVSSVLSNQDVDTSLLIGSIERIYVNKVDDHFILFLNMRYDALVNVRNILGLANMQAESSDERFWSVLDNLYGKVYFDIGFQGGIAITNIPMDTYTALEFDWELDEGLMQATNTASLGFWLWSVNLDFTDKFAFSDGYLPEWGLIATHGYDAEGYVLTTIAIPYSGGRGDKTTVKMVLPAILDNFDVKDTSALPYLDSVNNILLVEGIYIAPGNIRKYVREMAGASL